MIVLFLIASMFCPVIRRLNGGVDEFNKAKVCGNGGGDEFNKVSQVRANGWWMVVATIRAVQVTSTRPAHHIM